MIVDADAHVVESEHTWDFLDASEKKFRPQLFSSTDNSNMQYWFVEGKSIGFRPPTLTEQELIALIRQERNRLVLKPNDDYGGHGVFLGWESTADEWEQAIQIALERPYVVQERVSLKKTPMPRFTDRVRMEEMFIDFNPFLFHNEVEGALIRLSTSSLLNVTCGGGQTALLVMEGM